MGIAEQIRANQDVKEMTYRAIKILEAAGRDVSKEKAEFEALYGGKEVIKITFKEARAEARSMNGAYINRFKDGGWFVTRNRERRSIFYGEKDGALMPLTPGAIDYLKRRGNKYFYRYQWLFM